MLYQLKRKQWNVLGIDGYKNKILCEHGMEYQVLLAWWRKQDWIGFFVIRNRIELHRYPCVRGSC